MLLVESEEEESEKVCEVEGVFTGVPVLPCVCVCLYCYCDKPGIKAMTWLTHVSLSVLPVLCLCLWLQHSSQPWKWGLFHFLLSSDFSQSSTQRHLIVSECQFTLINWLFFTVNFPQIIRSILSVNWIQIQLCFFSAHARYSQVIEIHFY